MFLRPALFVVTLLCCAAPVAAADPAVPASLTVEERLQALEARQAELYHSLAEKKSAGLSEAISPHVSLSGLAEVEGSAGRLQLADGSRIDASDLSLATAQLGIDARANDRVGVNLTLLYEEDGEIEFDEAFIRLEQGGWQLRAGRLYLPFGAFHSHFISDPPTLVLGETRQTALLGGYSRGAVQVQAFAFNGDADRPGSADQVEDGGVSVTVTPAGTIEFGASILSDLAESNAELLAGNGYGRRVAGWSAYAHVAPGRLRLEAEVLAAARAFADSDLDVDADGRGDRPQAWNLEAAWELTPSLDVAARYAGSRELADEPRRQFGLDLSWSPLENTTLSLEYLHAVYAPDFAGGAEEGDRATTRLAVAF